MDAFAAMILGGDFEVQEHECLFRRSGVGPFSIAAQHRDGWSEQH